MSRINLLVYLSILCIFSSSCKFDLFEDYSYVQPHISIEGFEQSFDTTFVIVTVEESNEPIELIGIAYNYETPTITDNQQLYNGSEGTFLVPLVDLEPEETYEFIAFAGNSYSYGQSEPISFTVPIYTRAVPCELEVNELIFDGVAQALSNASVTDGGLTIFASTSNMSFNFSFSSPPTSGEYEVTTLNSLDTSKVKLTMFFDQFYNFDDGDVFIEQIENEHYLLSFCNLRTRENTPRVLKGNFEAEK